MLAKYDDQYALRRTSSTVIGFLVSWGGYGLQLYNHPKMHGQILDLQRCQTVCGHWYPRWWTRGFVLKKWNPSKPHIFIYFPTLIDRKGQYSSTRTFFLMVKGQIALVASPLPSFCTKFFQPYFASFVNCIPFCLRDSLCWLVISIYFSIYSW